MHAKPDAAREQHRDRFSLRMLVFSLAVVLGAGAVFAYRECRNEDERLRAVFQAHARTATLVVSPRRIVNLSGSAADLNTPDYMRLKEQLMLISSGEPRCHSLRILGMRGTEVFSFVDSEAPDSKDYFPPGQTYAGIPETVRRAFTGVQAVTGLYSDHWGTWITAVTPITSIGTQDVVAVLCMDDDAQDWAGHVAKHGAPAVLVTLFFAMTLVFFFVLLRRSDNATRRIAASEEARRRSEVELQCILDTTADGILAVDSHGKVIKANQHFADLWRIPQAVLDTGDDQILLNRVLEQLSDPAAFLQKVQALYGTDEKGMDTLAFKDGRVLERYSAPLIMEGSLVGRVWSFRDVTERKRAEEALRQSEEKYRALIETTNTGFVIVDAHGKVIDANQDYVRLTGHDALEEILGRSVVEWTAPYDLERNAHEVKKCAAQGFVRNLEIDYVNRGGQIPPIEINATVVGSGGSVRILALCRDITERKRAEEEIRRTAEEWQTTFDSIADMVSIQSADFNLVRVNRAYASAFGMKPEALVGKKCYEIVHGTARPVAECPHGRTLRTGEAARGEILDPRLGICLEVSTSPVFNAAGEIAGSIHIAKDITERKRAEEELRTVRDHIANIVNAIGDPVFVKDNQHRLVLVNDAQCALVGRARADLVGKTDADLFPREQTDVFWKMDDQVLSTGCENINEEVITGARAGENRTIVTRKTLYVDPAGNRFVVGVIRDVTERKRAEEALRESEEKYRSIFDESVAAIYAFDNKKKLINANQAGLDLLGYSRDELLHMSIPDVDADPAAVLPAHQELLSGGRLINYEHRLRRKDGTVITVLNNSRPLTDLHGNVVGMLSTLIDITERKHAEAEREKLEAQLRQAHKMEAVGKLAGGVAHDFNNLLQAILGYTEMVQSHLGPDTADGRSLDEVRKAGQRAAELTRQLLAFSRRQIIQPINLSLNDLIEGVLKMIRRLIGEHIELCFVSGVRLGTVHADKGQIEQVLMNLCVNARDAMPNGGTLTIETENVVIGDEYCREHPWATVGRYVLLSVTDTGHGMDETTRSQIFEPFFTTKDVGQGTGLGLATVYGIVKQHNGFIHVYSEPGKGTAFKVYLPIVERPAEDVGTKLEERAAGGTETILVAEDEEIVLNLVRSMLETAGYTVLTARDGEEALRVFAEHADEIDMALLDVMMPKLGGREVMDRIQAECPRIRFLFSSGYSENAIHTNFVIKEGLRLITKPYRIADLLRAIRETLAAREPSA